MWYHGEPSFPVSRKLQRRTYTPPWSYLRIQCYQPSAKWYTQGQNKVVISETARTCSGTAEPHCIRQHWPDVKRSQSCNLETCKRNIVLNRTWPHQPGQPYRPHFNNLDSTGYDLFPDPSIVYSARAVRTLVVGRGLAFLLHRHLIDLLQAAGKFCLLLK